MKKDIWESGLASEIEFWRDVLSGGNAAFNAELRARADPNAPVQAGILAELPARPSAEIKILDVASGPISWCGWLIDGKKANVTAVDALADVYNMLLDEYKISPPIRTIKGEAETLVEQFGKNQFDLVHILNALDHCYDPLRAVREMLDVAKSDGVVFIQGNLNEAEAAQYDGLHQWNIDVREGKLVFWNRTGVVVVEDHLPKVKITANSWPDGRWMNAYVRKSV